MVLRHHDVESATHAEGFGEGGRQFRRTSRWAASMRRSEQSSCANSRTRRARVDFTVRVDGSRITLFESTLAPVGAHYRRFRAATLGGR